MCCVYNRVYMAKLYWRYKKDGRWTWSPARLVFGDVDYLNCQIHVLIDLDPELFEQIKEEEE